MKWMGRARNRRICANITTVEMVNSCERKMHLAWKVEDILPNVKCKQMFLLQALLSSSLCDQLRKIHDSRAHLYGHFEICNCVLIDRGSLRVQGRWCLVRSTCPIARVEKMEAPIILVFARLFSIKSNWEPWGSQAGTYTLFWLTIGKNDVTW